MEMGESGQPRRVTVSRDARRSTATQDDARYATNRRATTARCHISQDLSENNRITEDFNI
jgi:hypothetical protein